MYRYKIMACSTCNKRTTDADRLIGVGLGSFPMNVRDVTVAEADGTTHHLNTKEWDNGQHKLLIFVPEAFTPVCESEIGAMKLWAPEFLKLGCELIAASTDTVGRMLNWYESEPSLKSPNFKTYSSYLLPSRLGILSNGRAKRASIFITNDGQVVKQEHFAMVGRSFEELHRTMWGYTTGTYCLEGWEKPI